MAVLMEAVNAGEGKGILRRPEVRVCQTETLVLLSIMEPDLSEEEISVSIESDTLTVEIERNLGNPVLAGRLFGTVEKDHCRVRVKADSVVIKLRKSVDGRWKSILEVGTEDIKAKVSPETRVRPIKVEPEVEFQEPIEPREPPKAASLPPFIGSGVSAVGFVGANNKIINNKGATDDQQRDDDQFDMDDTTPIQPSESRVIGVFENMKNFQRGLIGAPSYVTQATTVDEDDGGALDIEGPLVKRPDPRC